MLPLDQGVDWPLVLGQGSLIGSGAQVRPDQLKGPWADSPDAQKIPMISERPLGTARLDDALGEGLADLWQLEEFGPIGGVDVDLEMGCLPIGPLQFDHPAAVSPAAPPPGDRGQQAKEHEHGHGALIGPAEQPQRRVGGTRDRGPRGVFGRLASAGIASANDR